MTPLAPAVPGAPSYTTGIEMVLLRVPTMFDPPTVNVTVTAVDEEVGVTTTDDVVAEVGVAPVIAQE